MEVLEISEIRLFGLMAERLFLACFQGVFTGLLAYFSLILLVFTGLLAYFSLF